MSMVICVAARNTCIQDDSKLYASLLGFHSKAKIKSLYKHISENA